MTGFKWGLIGPGRIAENFATALKKVEGGHLYAVASRNSARAQAFANKYDVSCAYDSYAQMLANPQVDGVYIATPHMFHAAQIRQCLEAGKSVLCEKPMTLNATEAKPLFDMAAARGLFLMEALWTKFLPVYDQIHAWITAGKIGDVVLIRSTMGHPVGFEDTDRWLNPDLAGGALLDMGVYNITLSNWIAQGVPDTVHTVADMTPSGVDRMLTSVLRYDNGILSEFTCAVHVMLENRAYIHGTQGHITIEPPFWGAEHAVLTTSEGQAHSQTPHAANGFEYEIAAAQRSISKGEIQCQGRLWSETSDVLNIMDKMRHQIGLRYPGEV